MFDPNLGQRIKAEADVTVSLSWSEVDAYACFGIVSREWDAGDPSVGEYGGWTVKLQFLGAYVEDRGCIGLYPEQVEQLLGHDVVRQLRRNAEADEADEMNRDGAFAAA